MKKLTKDIFNQQIKHKKIISIGEYEGSNKITKFKCLIDGHEWYNKPANIKDGSGCPKCSGIIQYTNENIDKLLLDKNIKRISDCTNATTKVKFKCLVDGCGYEWETPPRQIVSKNSGCHKCNHHVKLTIIDINKKLKLKNIKCIGEYINTAKFAKFKCLVDGYEWRAHAGSVYHAGNGCPKCSNHIKYSDEIIDEKLKNRNIKRLSKSNGAHGKVSWKCLKDNHVWIAEPNDVIGKTKSGCPICRESKGENEIKIFLTNNSIKYERQYKFNDCKGKKFKLPFDFYLPDFKICIEFQGRQHYESIKFFGGKRKFNRLKKTDFIKFQYCKNNNINLICISYKEKNKIAEILKYKLNL